MKNDIWHDIWVFADFLSSAWWKSQCDSMTIRWILFSTKLCRHSMGVPCQFPMAFYVIPFVGKNIDKLTKNWEPYGPFFAWVLTCWLVMALYWQDEKSQIFWVCHLNESQCCRSSEKKENGRLRKKLRQN